MSEIHTLPGGEPLPENPLEIAPRAPGFCSHEAVILDAHERSVRCAKCDAALDAFSYLLSNARTIQRAWQNHAHVQRLAREASERVHELKKQETRLRAQVKRLQEKTAPLITRQREP